METTEKNKYFAYFVSKHTKSSSLNMRPWFTTPVPFTSKESALKWVLDELKKVQKSTNTDMGEFFVENEKGISLYSGVLNGEKTVYTVFDGVAVV